MADQKIVNMPLQARIIVDEIEEIKSRLISIETALIKSEKATKDDKKAVKEALEEYKKGKTIPFRSA